jgi:hypothetical protein
MIDEEAKDDEVTLTVEKQNIASNTRRQMNI